MVHLAHVVRPVPGRIGTTARVGKLKKDRWKAVLTTWRNDIFANASSPKPNRVFLVPASFLKSTMKSLLTKDEQVLQIREDPS
jgi:hypothetical protein